MVQKTIFELLSNNHSQYLPQDAELALKDFEASNINLIKTS